MEAEKKRSLPMKRIRMRSPFISQLIVDTCLTIEQPSPDHFSEPNPEKDKRSK